MIAISGPRVCVYVCPRREHWQTYTHSHTQARLAPIRLRRLGGDRLGGRGGLTQEEAGRARPLTLAVLGEMPGPPARPRC